IISASAAEIVKLLGSGSAYYSPSAGVLKIIESIVDDAHDVLEVAAILDGEYGLKDIAIGVPCVIGKNGIENIVELELGEEEKDLFSKSAKAIKSTIKLL
nr:malate dehydrogenase [Candidatus Omnitrophota bacterium]